MSKDKVRKVWSQFNYVIEKGEVNNGESLVEPEHAYSVKDLLMRNLSGSSALYDDGIETDKVIDSISLPSYRRKGTDDFDLMDAKRRGEAELNRLNRSKSDTEKVTPVKGDEKVTPVKGDEESTPV